MQSKFDSFFAEWNGRPCEVEDPSNPDQCMDLAFAWVDYLKIPREAIRHLLARQVWEQPTDLTRKYFDLIPNGALNIPKVGSLVVFNQKVGYAGHISIETGRSNYLNLKSFDQNWSSIMYCREVQHNLYYGVYGWLQPKVSVEDQLLLKIQDILNQNTTATDKLAQIKQIVA